MDWKAWLAAVFFTMIGMVALVLPDHPSALHISSFLVLPIEIPLAVVILLLLPRSLARIVAVCLTILLASILFLKIADISVQSAFQRRFNPYFDVTMIENGWILLSGIVGKWVAALAIGLGLAAFLTVIGCILAAQLKLIGLSRRAKYPLSGFYGVIALICLAVLSLTSVEMRTSYVSAKAYGYLSSRLDLVVTSIRDMHAFETALADKSGPQTGEGLFARVKDRDIILVFVESYGRSAVEDERYSSLIRPRLQSVEAELSQAGLSSASGWSLSPTMGGLSWLAHGTFLSGLWVDNQIRYDRLMLSDRPSLNRLFADAGWQTAAVMPAISMAWPEAGYFGYDRTFVAANLGYEGDPFNWVTMPDQYTLSAFERLVRKPAHDEGKSVMAEIALISSHAPWTPVPHLVDWNDVGDGTIFNDQANSGETPREVWADKDKIRRHYIETIDYSLETLGSYMARYGDDAIFVILGDHQPAPLVTGPDASRAVPVHVVSRDKELVESFLQAGFATGMIPGSDQTEIPMNDMRELLIDKFAAP
ncbi:sulfatase [Pseudohoeflea suaedae]|uniref:Sulfatase n=2 Tax=Pseudohoeflea suaedae TaxID=877384 RepID=A0A4R5PI69_9HYPH|nr:sulfatase [Pseudohoeflea suaedae]